MNYLKHQLIQSQVQSFSSHETVKSNLFYLEE